MHICSYYYGTKIYKNLFDKLIKKNINLKVYAPCAYNFKYKGDENYLITSECFKKWHRLFFYKKYNRVYNDLESKVNVSEYDIIHAHSLFSNGYVAHKLYEKYHIPYIVAVRNTDINVFFKYFFFLRGLGKKILRDASSVVFISNPYKQYVLDKYVDDNYKSDFLNKSVVIPNGIDDEWFRDQVKEKKINKNDKINIVFTGRIDKNKNVFTTIKACEILREKYDITYSIMGKNCIKNFDKIINNYSFINYLGVKNISQIKEIYKDMDIFIMPSRFETFGLSYVEAMSQGLPIIYTRGQGFDKYFDEGEVGYSTEYNDSKEIADNVDKIIEKYSDISRRCILNSKKFKWDDVSQKYSQLYNKILKNGSK